MRTFVEKIILLCLTYPTTTGLVRSSWNVSYTHIDIKGRNSKVHGPSLPPTAQQAKLRFTCQVSASQAHLLLFCAVCGNWFHRHRRSPALNGYGSQRTAIAKITRPSRYFRFYSYHRLQPTYCPERYGVPLLDIRILRSGNLAGTGMPDSQIF